MSCPSPRTACLSPGPPLTPIPGLCAGRESCRGGRSRSELHTDSGCPLTPPSCCLPVLRPRQPRLCHTAGRGCALPGALEAGIVPAPCRSAQPLSSLHHALGPSATSWGLGRCRVVLLTLTFITSTLSKPEPSWPYHAEGLCPSAPESWWHWVVDGGRAVTPCLGPVLGCSRVALTPQIRPELFLSELQRNYRGDEDAEVFSVAWNTLMVMFSCCGVLGPEDFGNGSRFQELHPGTPWPRACCARDGLLQAGELLGWEQCRERSPGYIHEQGCFPTFGRTLQNYISVPGTCSLAVLGIEVRRGGWGDTRQAAGHPARVLFLPGGKGMGLCV
uniref:Uncharacterized protein n=1 Tax=Anser cygnoides TaxID=8845 RepID=A0A8B9EJ26_ANSCY